jgi:hypothetical protein
MTQAALANFGVGQMYGTRTDVANATPIAFGILQDTTFDFSFTTKPLMGQNQFAVFVARAEAKWTAKAKAGVLSGRLLNDIFFGQSLAAGQTQLAAAEPHTASGTNVTVTNSTTFVADEGMVYAGSLLPLIAVTSSPSAGQYSFAAGVYSLSASDSGTSVLVSYTYSIAGSGQKITLTNQLLGTTPTFSAVFRNRDARSGLFTTWVFNRLTSSKLTIASKSADYSIPEFDMEIMDDGTGTIGTMSFGDIS